MKKIALVCDDNYINWITHLIQIESPNNFFYIFCINKNIQSELKKIKSNNFKTFLFTKYKKRYSSKFINKIEENLNCSLIEVKKSIYAYDEFFKSKNFEINEIQKNNVDQYLYQVYGNLRLFFKKYNIDYFFLEQDNGLISFLIKKICEKKNIKYFLFYETYFSNTFLILDGKNYFPVSKNNLLDVLKLKKKFRSLKNTTLSSNEEVWQSNYKKSKTIFKKVFETKQKLDTDFFHLNFLERCIIKLKKLYFSYYYKNIQINYLPKNYVVFYLSYQPEASTYGFGAFGTNQLYLIRIIRENLPQNIHLILKEHPEQFQKIPRKKSFYENILRLKNTHFISTNFNKKKLLTNANLIFTISGTIALEAALIEKKVIIFSKLIYSLFKKNISYVNNINNLNQVIKKDLKKRNAKIFFSDFKKFRNLFLNGELFFKNKNNEIAAKSIDNFIRRFS